MGTEVLRPQDFLIERLRVGPAVLPRRKSYTGNPKPCRKPVSRPDTRKRFPQPEPSSISRKLSASSDDSNSAKNFGVGQVTILKRGESLHVKGRDGSVKKNVAFSSEAVDLVVCGTERLGPDPELVPKQIRIADLKSVFSPVHVRSDMYAGSAFSLSPSPSSLPLPTFSRKKDGFPIIVDDSATKDLRRLLRLD